MTRDEDFVLYVVGAVQRCCDTFTAEMAISLESQIRRDWGGNEPYINAISPRERDARRARVRKAVAEVAAGSATPSQAARTHGVDRTEIYRLLRPQNK